MFNSFPILFPFAGNLLPSRVSYLLGKILWLFSAADCSPRVDRETDRKMVEEALAGDPGFEKLVRVHERMVYRVAFRYLNNETDASDVTQEVFIRVHRALPKF